MKTLMLYLAAMLLTACGPSEIPRHGSGMPSVEELATGDPARLKGLRQQCRTDRATLGDVFCDQVAEATRKRFYGNRNTPYTQSEESATF